MRKKWAYPDYVLEPFLDSFLDEMEKIAEYAPGIPEKTISHELPTLDKPATWEFGIHEHLAEKRGRHFDLRLGDPETGHAHSWVVAPKDWPTPGKSTWAIQQPTHTVKYMDFEGEIAEGYGKGKVNLHDRTVAEVSKSGPGHLNFNVYRSHGPEEFTLHRVTGKNWIFMNRTLSREKMPELPTDKPKYKELPVDKAPIDDPNYLFSAKIDDAHNLFVFPHADKPVRVVSYRPGKRSPGGIIDHTHKVPSIAGVRTPSGMGGTILRGGLYALHPDTGAATAPEAIAGMLNSDVWKSREKQKTHGELRPVLYDVVRYKGKDMASAPYAEKLKVLHEVVSKLPGTFELPRMATSSKDKKELLEAIHQGKVPETKEGVVAWHLTEGKAPIKVKFHEDHDVHVRGFFSGEGKYKGKGVGGFTFSHTPDGPVVGKVGTGLSDAQRKDMHEHPEKYVGLVARVKAQQKYQSGALRAPSFQGWHLDKNDPQDLSAVS
jgi:hypothetical protein